MIRLLSFLLPAALFASGITNTTDAPMRCDINIPARYAKERIHGIVQNVKIAEANQTVMILSPGASLPLYDKGHIVCFNRKRRYEAFGKRVTQLQGEALTAFTRKLTLTDIGAYANEDKAFLKQHLGHDPECRPFKNGEYCFVLPGLDAYLTRQGRIKRLFLYGLQHDRLPFSSAAFEGLRIDNLPLEPEILQRNKHLIAAKPTFASQSVRIWKQPGKWINLIVMNAKEGHPVASRYNKQQPVATYFGSLEIVYKLDDAAYRKHQEEKQSRSSHPREVPYKAFKTWGDTLNPQGRAPQNLFKAFYINTNNPDRVIASETVKEISVNYAWDKFHGIKSQDFGAYWVGDIIVPEDTDKRISLSLSWAKARVIIDKTVVFEGDKSTAFTHRFTKGKHRVEVEYVNNWHTTDFMMRISDKTETLTPTQLNRRLAALAPNARVVFAGIYESKNKNHTVLVSLSDKTMPPSVLLLSSYESVTWILSKKHLDKIKAVVVASYKPGSVVHGFDKQRIFYLNRYLGIHRTEKTCTCVNGGAQFHCSGAFGDEVIKKVQTLTGLPVYGFTTAYATHSINIPKIRYDTKTKRRFARNRREVEAAQKACLRQSNPSFESMMPPKRR